jgi:chorismate mutase
MARKKTESQEMTNKEKREKMVEVQTGKRVFDTEKYGLLQIRFPLVEENRLADWEYSKVFHQAIMDEIPTNKEVEAMIKKRNLWTEEDEEKIADLRSKIDVQLVLLSKMETEKNMKPIQDKIDELRQEIFQLQQERQKFFNNTAEAKADEAKMSFLISRVTEYADTGKKVWEKYNDFKDEPDQATVNDIVMQFLTFINGLPADFLTNPSEVEGETVEEEDSEE